MTDSRLTQAGTTIDRVILSVLLVLVPVAAVVGPMVRWATGRPLVWEGQIDDSAPLPHQLAAPAEGASVEWTGTGAVTIEDPAPADRLLAMLPDTLLALAICAGGLLLVAALHRIRTGRPFDPANARAIQIVGVIVVAAGFGIPFVNGLVNEQMMEAALADGIHAHVYTASFGWLALAFALWTIAQAFRHGERLQRDAEGLV